MSDRHLADAIRNVAHPLSGAPSDWDPLLSRIGGARVVLLGEATHGTHEFYRARAVITRRLIVEMGFHAVAIEGDWPDAARVDRYVRGGGEGGEASDALGGFRRFPTWMWRNADVLDFVGWLREHNDRLPEGVPRAGFYGLDLYSLYTSIESVLGYLDRADPAAAARARRRYACFEHFGSDEQAYGYVAGLDLTRSCEEAVVRQLVELHQGAGRYRRSDGQIAEDQFFQAQRNATLVKNAERYYRTMFAGHVSSWNLRDEHMAETLDALIAHLDRQVGRARVVVWAHNSHLGDARATEMSSRGELNLGQLARERWEREAVLVGFTTDHGTVAAASRWDAAVERKRVRPGLGGSYEALLHAVGVPRFLVDMRELGEAAAALAEPRLERAIGVVYLPGSERVSHYFDAQLPSQFDVVIHYDETRATEPLERAPAWAAAEPPETFPSGL